MEFIPICLNCENFKKNDKCPYYRPIPFEIKNREKRCNYYKGDEDFYPLYWNDSKPKGEKNA